MIEFTLSRVSMMICGLVLLSAIMIPISSAYDSMEEEDLTEVTDDIALMIDSFWDSKADVMFLRGWDILPTPTYWLELNENELVLTDGNKEYRSLISHASQEFTISYDELATIERNGERLTLSYQ